jgi:hypothetical protein
VRVGRAHLYAVLAIAAVVAYAVGVGSYWLADMVVFAAVASAVAWFCFARGVKKGDIDQVFQILGPGAPRLGYRSGLEVNRSVERDGAVTEPDQRESVPRSRIAHYVIVSRIKSATFTAWLRRESDSPFERALLCEPGWRTLSGEGLEEVIRKAPDASANRAQ